jgi:chromosome segregation ATPase
MKRTLEEKVDLLVEKVSQIDVLVENVGRINGRLDDLTEKTSKIDFLVEKVGQIDVLVENVAQINGRLDELTEKTDILVEGFARHEAILDRQEAVLDTVAIEVLGLKDRMGSLEGKVDTLEESVTDGFTNLDTFVHELTRQDQEMVAQRSAIRRHEDRLEILERV